MNERLARFLFLRRNALFPVVLAALLALWPPLTLESAPGRTLLAAGLAMVALGQGLRVLTIGLRYIKRGGKKGRFYADDLVTEGIFAHCRNPLYVGNILIGLGFLGVAGNPWALGVGGALILWAYSLIVGGEERYLAGRFGEAYRAYCRETPRWGIRVGGLARTLRSSRFDWVRLVNKEYGTLYTSVLIPAALIGWKAYRTGGEPALRQWLVPLGMATALATAGYAAARLLKKSGRLEPRAEAPGADADPMIEWRRRIDRIDERLLGLLNERAGVVESIFRHKKAHGVARHDPDRVRSVIARLKGMNQGPLREEQVERLFSFLLGESLRTGEVEPGVAARAGGGAEVVVTPHVRGPSEVAHVEG